MGIIRADDYYLQHRDTYPEPLRLRLHRSLSWLKRAEAAEDLDTRFITLWIAFNAAYAREIDGRTLPGDRSDFRGFLRTVCRMDRDKAVYQLVWQTFSGSIRVLLENRFVFQPFWDFHNGKISEDAWLNDFAQAKRKAQAALAAQDTDTVLLVVFDRLYMLRNQMVHGGATFESRANRSQLRDACAVLSGLIPLILMVMQQNAGHDWGKPFYPYIEGEGGEYA
ncbi:HEPN domain-containing protein [Neisseria sp.]|uniref:HEPN domain-containing protein n=1 Tax=Neisseria sp. TaxID=192066 RepID=UPI0026DC64DC|nr:HEPN domain-containing protein [Neisseria sp.]MDO4907972.1 HEPN domain-containing protein [Neisseria sp.]